jgi:glycosyltransferase involved in cell wall biosynthesis
MKICLMTNLYPPTVQGGAEIYVGHLARALSDEHRVVVITTEPGLHIRPRRESIQNLTVYRLAPANVAHLTTLPHHLVPQAAFRGIDLIHPQVAASVATIMAREQPDIVHIHNWVGLSLGGIMAAISDRKAVAMTLHDYSLICTYATLRHPDGHRCGPDWPCRLLTAINRRLISRIGLVVSPSQFVLAEHLRRGFFEHAIQQVLPYGLEAVSPVASADRAEAPSKETFDILFMGRVQSHKGIDALLRAFSRLSDSRLRLHIAGIGPSLELCRQFAASDARIRIYGFVSGDRRNRLIADADCLALPSLWPDNFPVSIQEAFVSGVVVIASRAGGIPEMVRDGINGLLVEPGDEAGLTAAIDRLQKWPELAARLRASALETARLYNMRFHVARLTDAYRQLLTVQRAGGLDNRAA